MTTGDEKVNRKTTEQFKESSVSSKPVMKGRTGI
jgi:hypothetical protein